VYVNLINKRKWWWWWWRWRSCWIWTHSYINDSAPTVYNGIQKKTSTTPSPVRRLKLGYGMQINSYLRIN